LPHSVFDLADERHQLEIELVLDLPSVVANLSAIKQVVGCQLLFQLPRQRHNPRRSTDKQARFLEISNLIAVKPMNAKVFLETNTLVSLPRPPHLVSANYLGGNFKCGRIALLLFRSS
jgi:hypothetical protein